MTNCPSISADISPAADKPGRGACRTDACRTGACRTGTSRLLAGVLSAILLSACVSTGPRQLVPSLTLSPETVSLSNGEAIGPGLNFGLSTSINESDSLSNITVLPGIRVRSVVAGGAADLAGIQAGDVVLKIDGREINHPDLLAALAQQSGSAQSFQFEVRRDTTVFSTSVEAGLVSDLRSAPVELYRVDPVATRAGFVTEVYESAGDIQSGARIVEILPQSPFAAADLNIGDTIVALEGEPIASAQDFITRIHTEFDLGSTVGISVLRDTGSGLDLLHRELTLWNPGRRLNRLSLGPVLQYESNPDPQQTRLSIGDLWLFSLFSYEHLEGEKEYRLLGMFRFATGYGELLEEDGQ